MQVSLSLPRYSIQEVARLCGLPASTLRYYEKIGLFAPVERDKSSKHRVYSEDDLNLATALACLSAAGLSIADMRRYLANRAGGSDAVADQIELLQAHDQRLQQELADLQMRQRYIAARVAYWRSIASGDASAREAISAQVRDLAARLHHKAPQPTQVQPAFEGGSDRPRNKPHSREVSGRPSMEAAANEPQLAAPVRTRRRPLDVTHRKRHD